MGYKRKAKVATVKIVFDASRGNPFSKELLDYALKNSLQEDRSGCFNDVFHYVDFEIMSVEEKDVDL